VLVPAPDYPLWTAVVSLSGGTPVHYRCDEAAAGCPIWTTSAPRSRRTPRRIVVINPNNPTGALYPDELLRGIVELAREHG
jgi:alanine-synthesizing transaminase